MTPNKTMLPGIGDLVAGRYRIIRELGRGGYGVVFHARQEAIDRDVAIKFLLPDVASDPMEVERFRREIFHASSLENRHTITLYDYGKSPAGLFYVVMEFLEGHDLRDHLHESGPLSEDQAYQILEQVLESLNEAHRRKLVHRDLKPDNIFLLQSPADHLECRVLDFGLSKFIGDPRSTLYRGPSLTAEGQVCGTPQYMSPEHAYGDNVLPPGDIYSLGLVLFEAVTGQPAFDAKAPLDVLLKQVNETTPPLPERLQDSPLSEFIARATEKEPEARFADAAQALAWLYEHPIAPAASPQDSAPGPTLLRPAGEALPAPQHATDAQPSTPAAEEASLPETTLVDAPPDLLSNREESTPKESTDPQFHSAPAAGPTATEADASAPPPNRMALERFELRVAQTPLIGRRRSLARLDAWLDRARATGGLFVITGNAGIGKSALLHTWCNQLKTRGGLRVLASTQRPGSTPLSALRTAFSDLLSPRTQRTSGAINASISRRLQQLLSTDDDADNPRSMSDVIHGLTQTLEHLSYDRPPVLVIDDLHLSDPVTRGFIDHLVESLSERSRPLAVVVTARHRGQLESLDRSIDEVTTTWHLPELTSAQADELLRRLIPTTDALADAVVTLAGGNPALLLHICRYLLESQLIGFDSSRNSWALCDPTMAIEEMVPLDLQQLIIERADRYLRQSDDEASLRAILHRAVLLGDDFGAPLLDAVLRAEGLTDLADKSASLLTQLTRAGLLREQSLDDHRHFSFARPLHRASLVRMVNGIDDWRSFHLLVADTIIDARADASWFDARRIAHHLEQARAGYRALPWWLRAARQAEAEHRLQDALHMVHRALRLHRRIDVDDRLLAQLRLQQGRLSRSLGELGPAEDALREAQKCGRRSEESKLAAEAGELLAEVISLQGRLDEAATILNEIDGVYQVLDDNEGRQRVRLARADIAMFHGDYDDAKAHFRALQSAGANEAKALVGLTRCHYAAGDLARARSTVDEARHRAHHSGQLSTEAAAHVDAAYIALVTEGVEAAEALAHQALGLARRNDDLLVQANAHLALGISLRRSTNIDRARFHSRRARELHESLGHIYGIIKDILLSAEIAWVQGEPERALILAEDTARLHDDLGDRHGWALSALFRSLFLVELGRPGEARKLLNQVLTIKTGKSLGLYEPQTLFYLGLAHEAEQDIDQAMSFFQQAQQSAKAMGHREFYSLTTISLAKLQIITGQMDQARPQIARSLQTAEQLGHGYANMFALLGSALIARLDGDPERLHDYLTRLRTYTVTPYAPQMRLRRRLDGIAQLLNQLPESDHSRALHRALTDLREGL